jgi:serine/threonine-protein kinase
VSRGAQGRVGSVVNGKWQIDARIGSGGMATVYSATHRNGHRAAIKMLHTQLSRDPSTRARFLREGYVANAVAHPGVVSVLDDGVTEDGAVYLVLELLEGETIDDRRIRLGGSLPIDEALEVADDALDALAAAHGKGIVHRDVKPENVFRTILGQIKLLDFGLARMKDSQAEATKTGVTIGTPQFMPPEQALGRRDAVDPRSDVWGLGATMFTMITGRFVHDDAQSLHEQLMASATRRSPPIRSLAPRVSPAVAVVIDRALELEMSDRWPSAREMQAALRGARAARRPVFGGVDSTTVETSVPASGPSPGSAPTDEHVLPSTQNTTRMKPPQFIANMDAAARRALLGPINTPPDGVTLKPATGSAITVAGTREHNRIAVSDSAITDVRVDAPTVAASWTPSTSPSPRAMHAAGPVHGSPRAFPGTDDQGLPTGPHLPSGPLYPPLGYSSAPLPPLPPLPPVRGRQSSSLRPILLVAIGFAVVCAAMAAYVLWHGAPPAIR